MATPKYFNQFPNIEYPYRLNKAGIADTIQIKDYFHFLTVRDGIFKNDTLYTPYYINNGERPDQISWKLYSDEQYYWIILQINNIVDYYNEWPLSYTELEEFIVKKYGSIPASDEIHHYETVEIKDEEGNLLVPGRGTPTPERGGLAQNGLVVSEDYTFTHRTTPTSNVFVTKSGVDARIGITNRQYEYDVNENKSQITTLQKRFIGDYVREYKKYTNNIKSMKGVLDVGDLT